MYRMERNVYHNDNDDVIIIESKIEFLKKAKFLILSRLIDY